MNKKKLSIITIIAIASIIFIPFAYTEKTAKKTTYKGYAQFSSNYNTSTPNHYTYDDFVNMRNALIIAFAKDLIQAMNDKDSEKCLSKKIEKYSNMKCHLLGKPTSYKMQSLIDEINNMVVRVIDILDEYTEHLKILRGTDTAKKLKELIKQTHEYQYAVSMLIASNKK